MKLKEEQKVMIGIPPIVALALAGLIIPICLADQGRSPWWLLLWIPFAIATGLMLAALHWWMKGSIGR